jgi:hypothetical protein
VLKEFRVLLLLQEFKVLKEFKGHREFKVLLVLKVVLVLKVMLVLKVLLDQVQQQVRILKFSSIPVETSQEMLT